VVHGGRFTRGRRCRTLAERESVCMAGLCVRAILINTVLTPRPWNINHKTMENGAWGGEPAAGSKYSIVVYAYEGARCTHTCIHTHARTQR